MISEVCQARHKTKKNLGTPKHTDGKGKCVLVYGSVKEMSNVIIAIYIYIK